MTKHFLDRLTQGIAPRWTLKRQRARLAGDLMQRYYDAASSGRRTEGWRRVSGDGNAATQRGRPTRETARDLVRNNSWAKSARRAIVNHVIGWGITPKLPPGRFGTAWRAWADTTACDADGRRTLNGLSKLALGTVVDTGECLIRRRIRRLEDDLPIPLQLQVLEPDLLDETKDTALPNGGEIIQGVEFDAIGRRVAYWLFPQHPGTSRIGVRGSTSGAPVRIPASEILHVADPDRAGQVRDVSWMTNVMLRLKDADDFEDATLMKQKVAACLAVILTDTDGSGVPLGTADDTTTPGIDSLQPGLIARFAAGNTAQVVQPPSVNDYGPYMKRVLEAIATGLGISYESLTGDFSEVNFSSARMARLREWDNVHHWRWDMMVPQFYSPIWDWAVQVGAVVGLSVPATFVPEWTAPPMPMIEPDKEGLAYQRNIRTGIQTLSDVLRELGYDPDQFFEEMAADYERLDRLKLILDSDPRNMTQAGQLQGKAAAAAVPRPEPEPEPASTEPSADAARADRLEAAVLRLAAETNGHRDERPMLAPGAIHVPVTVQAAAPPAVTVDARTSIEPGAMVLNVQASPPAAITVEGPTVNVAPPTLAEGAVRVEAPVTIAEGAVRVESPVTVTPPAPHALTVFRSPPTRRRKRLKPEPAPPPDAP